MSGLQASIKFHVTLRERSLRPKSLVHCGGDSSVPLVAQSDMARALMNKEYCVYIMTNKSRSLYTGVTNDLMRRVYEHKNKLDPNSFTNKYNIRFLAYYESTSSVHAALERENQIKGWLRTKKIALIDSMNPGWKDLSEEWFV